MSSDNNDERMNSSRAERLQQIETVAFGHLHVKKYQIRNDISIKLLALSDRRTLSNNTNLRITREEKSDATPRERFTIDNQCRNRR